MEAEKIFFHKFVPADIPIIKRLKYARHAQKCHLGKESYRVQQQLEQELNGCCANHQVDALHRFDNQIEEIAVYTKNLHV